MIYIHTYEHVLIIMCNRCYFIFKEKEFTGLCVFFIRSYKGRFRVMNDGTIRRWKEGKRHNAHLKVCVFFFLLSRFWLSSSLKLWNGGIRVEVTVIVEKETH